MKTREMLSVQRTKKVIEYVNEHGGRVSIVELACELHCSYETVRKYVRIFQSEGMDIQTTNEAAEEHSDENTQ